MEWCALQEQLARELLNTAQLPQVRERAEAILSKQIIDKSTTGLIS